MRKVIFFEDEFYNLEILVSWINRTVYDNKLLIEVVLKTTEATDYKSISESYDAIFVDIELANKSKDDGISVVKKLIQLNKKCIGKIAIISGHSGLGELLAKENLSMISVYEKPLEKDVLIKALELALKG